MKSWRYGSVHIKDWLECKLKGLLLFPLLKIQINQNLKENCSCNTIQMLSNYA